MGAKVQEIADRCAGRIRRRQVRLERIANGNGEALAGKAGVVGAGLPSVGDVADGVPAAPTWRSALVQEADEVCRHRLSFFDLDL